ncbi:MAG: hypothetical protein ISN29_05765 [Gammaproteobacteria bacterium AqS3]|nr:hypothetical protein [Gammaproteobacteria bacterium AqS3]
MKKLMAAALMMATAAVREEGFGCPETGGVILRIGGLDGGLDGGLRIGMCKPRSKRVAARAYVSIIHRRRQRAVRSRPGGR